MQLENLIYLKLYYFHFLINFYFNYSIIHYKNVFFAISEFIKIAQRVNFIFPLKILLDFVYILQTITLSIYILIYLFCLPKFLLKNTF
jgi:hypothetical protein